MKPLCLQKGRRGIASRKEYQQGPGTHTPGRVPDRSLGYISPLFHSGVLSHLSCFLCAQAAWPPLSLSQRKWAKKHSRGNPLMYFWDGEYSPLRIPLPSFLRSYEPTHRLFSGRLPPQTCQKRQGRGIFPLENPLPSFLRSWQPTQKALSLKSFVNLSKGCRVSGQRPDSRSAERETPFCP